MNSDAMNCRPSGKHDSALREEIEVPKGAAADTVHNMGAESFLDTIIKQLTIISGSVKSFDLLMRDFYRADLDEEESIPSFANRIEGLLSRIREKFPDQIHLH